MVARFDYTKLIIENINKIVPMVILIITTLSASTAFQTWNVFDTEDKGNKNVHEVTKAFQQEITQNYEYIEPKTTFKVKPFNWNKVDNRCQAKCDTAIINHKKASH